MPNIRKCAVFCCNKTHKETITLHRFPENYTNRWIEVVNRGSQWKPNTCSYLCDEHFAWVTICYHFVLSNLIFIIFDKIIYLCTSRKL